MSKYAVCISIANDITVLDVVLRVVNVFLYQSSIGLASRSIVLWEMGVNENVVKYDTFTFQRIKDEIMYRPEGILWERFST